ncbi:DUF2855 family protein [Marinicella sediminis]|uniref:DUF2855 family protein n=1 Tax=Marinicella sediminis TaxID=1792834 RepID=A0ABV7JB87_9GAMM|nr:DUF2855 family protein [Marinicella sediminis]
MAQFQVHKQALKKNRIIAITNGDLQPGQIRVRIQAFGFSANNITYWAMGERMRYWQFFPAADNDGEQWGVIPVWGYAEVEASKHDEVSVGERLFGYFPTADCLVMRPGRLSSEFLFDASEHRQTLPAGYNRYQRLSSGQTNDQQEALNMLLFPLHITSFCLFDTLVNEQKTEMKQLLVTSASSKTALGLVQGFKNLEHAPYLIGLTADKNLGFVKSLGCYDQVLCYEENGDINAHHSTVIVDFSGNGKLLGQLHEKLQDHMRHTWHVGLTHWSDNDMGSGYLAERSEVFFAPAYIQEKMAVWGAAEFQKRSTQYLHRAALASRDWLVINNLSGLKALAAVFKTVADGALPAEQGLIVRLY